MLKTTAHSGRRQPARFARAAGLALFSALAIAAPAVAADPTVTTLPQDSTLLTDTYALLSGTVNPNGSPTVYQFQYGTTTDYGLATDVTSASNGKIDVPVDASLDELTPNTTYHFRLIAFPDPAQSATYGIKQIYGADQTFKTTKSLAVSFAGKKATVTNGKAGVALTAIGPPDEAATGKLTLTAKITTLKITFTGKGKKRKKHVEKTTKTVKIGKASYSVAVGKTKTIKVALNKAAKTALKTGKLKAKASALTKGASAAVTTTLTLAG